MPRVDVEDVQAIRPGTVNPIPFIVTASLLVDQYLLEEELSELFLTEIEKWWAAHLCELADPLVTTKKLGETQVTISHGKLGEGLASTRYGQMVIMMWPAFAATTNGGTGIITKKATFHVF
jgi:hypothetical protein